jgi:hypothetical protein
MMFVLSVPSLDRAAALFRARDFAVYPDLGVIEGRGEHQRRTRIEGADAPGTVI